MIDFEKVKDRINFQVEECKDLNEDLDDCNWIYQHGVLITVNEATLLLKEIEQVKKHANNLGDLLAKTEKELEELENEQTII
jgi:hypothetical protein